MSNHENSMIMAGVIITIFIIVIGIFFIRRKYNKKNNNKFEQKNPYVATVDLSERYGGLEKKEVKISNLSTEQLVLLKRDGKLNSETISMLESDGKLPLEDGSFIKKKKIEVNSGGINKNSVDIDEWIRDSPGLKKRDKKNKKNEIH